MRVRTSLVALTCIACTGSANAPPPDQPTPTVSPAEWSEAPADEEAAEPAPESCANCAIISAEAAERILDIFDDLEIDLSEDTPSSDCMVSKTLSSDGEGLTVTNGWVIQEALVYRDPSGGASALDYRFVYMGVVCGNDDETCPRSALGTFATVRELPTKDGEPPNLENAQQKIETGSLSGWMADVTFARGETGGVVHFYSPGAVAVQEACNAAQGE